MVKLWHNCLQPITILITNLPSFYKDVLKKKISEEVYFFWIVPSGIRHVNSMIINSLKNVRSGCEQFWKQLKFLLNDVNIFFHMFITYARHQIHSLFILKKEQSGVSYVITNMFPRWMVKAHHSHLRL